MKISLRIFSEKETFLLTFSAQNKRSQYCLAPLEVEKPEIFLISPVQMI